MPWKVRQRGDQFCVMKINDDDTEETVKCHPTRDKALAQQRALYVNVGDKELAVVAEVKRGKPLLMPSIAQLRAALETVETNAPINEAEGNLEQAELERENAASFREAIGILSLGKSLDKELASKVRAALFNLELKGK
jgi:hypothetical protein